MYYRDGFIMTEDEWRENLEAIQEYDYWLMENEDERDNGKTNSALEQKRGEVAGW